MSKKRIFSFDEELSGSPDSGEPEFLAVGKLKRPHGIKGEIRMSVWTDYPERLKPGSIVYVGKTPKPVLIHSIRWHGEDLLVSFKEFPTRENVGLLRNQVVTVPIDDLPPLPEGEIYIHEMIGMEVLDVDTGSLLGIVTEIIETGANDVFVVRDHLGIEILLPDIDEVILSVAVEEKQIRVHLLPGLID